MIYLSEKYILGLGALELVVNTVTATKQLL